jgi:hypothetical protein
MIRIPTMGKHLNCAEMHHEGHGGGVAMIAELVDLDRDA